MNIIEKAREYRAVLENIFQGTGDKELYVRDGTPSISGDCEVAHRRLIYVYGDATLEF